MKQKKIYALVVTSFLLFVTMFSYAQSPTKPALLKTNTNGTSRISPILPQHGFPGPALPTPNKGNGDGFSVVENLYVTEDLRVGRTISAGSIETNGLKIDSLTVSGNIKANGNVTGTNIYGSTGYFSSIQNTGNFIVTGNEGIGVASPSEKLEVAGNIKSSQNIIAQGAQIMGAVGIGVAPANYKLSVAGDTYVNGMFTTEKITVKQNLTLNGGFSLTGPLGIGVTSPQATLHVNGNGQFDGNIKANQITVNSIVIAQDSTQGNNSSSTSASSLNLGNNLVVNGSIAIGTTKTDGYKLSVNGKIRASDIIKVYPESQWSDFVFEKNYKLLPLNEVNEYIKKNGHLPDMPSAKEVEKEGIDLGSMDAKLLQKIEELTLYVIEMKKENEQLKREVKDLKSNKR